jgi:non-heme chloroperoxidase
MLLANSDGASEWHLRAIFEAGLMRFGTRSGAPYEFANSIVCYPHSAFLDGFMTDFFAAGDRTDLISEPSRLYYREIAAFAAPKGTLECIAAYSRTDFREDLAEIDVPTLVVHGDSDALDPFEATGKRSHEAIAGSSLALIEGGPHGLNLTHPERFNRALLGFPA